MTFEELLTILFLEKSHFIKFEFNYALFDFCYDICISLAIQFTNYQDMWV